jgi:hypothetical protein
LCFLHICTHTRNWQSLLRTRLSRPGYLSSSMWGDDLYNLVYALNVLKSVQSRQNCNGVRNTQQQSTHQMTMPHAEPPGSQLCGYVAFLHHRHYSSSPSALGEAASARSNGPCRYQVEPATAPLASRRIMGRTAVMCEMLSWSYDVDRCRVMVITP